MLDAIINERGWCCIRLGAGEYWLLESFRRGEPVGCVRDPNWIEKCLPGVDWETAGRALYQAVIDAPIIALPRDDFARCNPEYRVRELLGKLEVSLEGKQITCLWVGIAFRYHSEWMEQLGHNRTVGSVYRDSQKSANAISKICKPQVSVGFNYPSMGTSNNELVERSIVANGCNPIFVSGGPYGKALCVQLYKQGLVAFDYGSMAEWSDEQVNRRWDQLIKEYPNDAD